MRVALAHTSSAIRRDSRDGGRRARLRAISCPVLAAAANDDPVAPVDSVRPLLDVIGSDDKEWLQAHGSHLSLIAGAEARHRVWPTIVRWLAARDEARR